MKQKQRTLGIVLTCMLAAAVLSVFAACSSKLSGKFYYYDSYREEMYDFYIEFDGDDYQCVTAEGEVTETGTVKYDADGGFVLYNERGEAGTGTIVREGVILLDIVEGGYYCKKDAQLP